MLFFFICLAIVINGYNLLIFWIFLFKFVNLLGVFMEKKWIEDNWYRDDWNWLF